MKSFFLFILASLSLFAGDNRRVVGGPFVVNLTATKATVVWITDGGDLSLTVPGLTGIEEVAEILSPSLHVEKTTLTGLKPNTRYEYDLSAQGAGKGSFKTAPAPAGTAVPVDFVIYGDNRTRPIAHQQVIDSVLRHGTPDFIVQTGDLVADGSDSSQWPEFFSIERDLLRQTAIFPALGNHEHNSSDFYQFFQVTSPWYSFDWGKIHFSVLDSDIDNVSPFEGARAAFWAEQTQWLANDLQAHQNADFRFVIAHHPPFTAVTKRQGDNPHMAGLLPMMEKYRVTAAFFGHDHNYQHYLKNGIHYAISGGGGAPLYDVDTPPALITQKVVSVENFLAVHVEGKVAHVQAIGTDGTVLDEFDLDSSALVAPKAKAVSALKPE